MLDEYGLSIYTVHHRLLEQKPSRYSSSPLWLAEGRLAIMPFVDLLQKGGVGVITDERV